jgi:hypothetical protein
MNGELGRKWSWPDLSYYLSTYLEDLTETRKNVSQGARIVAQGLQAMTPEYEAGLLTIRQQYSLCAKDYLYYGKIDSDTSIILLLILCSFNITYFSFKTD